MLLPSKSDIAKLLGKKLEDTVVGYASSIADLFHAGHIAYLREAKKHCDYLIVGIVDDPTKDRSWKNKPVQSLFERYIQVASCVYADCVIPLSGEQDLRDSLLLLQPDVRFVGEEYKNMQFTGDDIEDIKIVYLPRRHSFSSSDLRQRTAKAESGKVCSCGCNCKEESENKSPSTIPDSAKYEPHKGYIDALDAEMKDIGKQDY